MWENFTLYLFSYILVVIFQWYFKLWCNRPNGSVQQNSFGNRVLFCACFMSCRRYFLLLFFHYSRNFCVRLTVNHQIKTMSHSDNKTTHKNTSYQINTNQLHSNHTKIVCRQSRNAIYLRAIFTYLLDRRKTIFTMSSKWKKKKHILWFVYAYLWFLTTVNINFIAVQFLWSFSVVCCFFFVCHKRPKWIQHVNTNYCKWQP